jgi:hypothetical protein
MADLLRTSSYNGQPEFIQPIIDIDSNTQIIIGITGISIALIILIGILLYVACRKSNTYNTIK